MVLYYVDPFLSEADIEAGKRWSDVVASELEASNFGIICVTQQSVSAPWVLFEAGALAKSLEGSVIPLLLDLEFRQITGPLAQFQAKKVDKGGMKETVHAMNSAAGLVLPELRLNEQFDALWPNLEKQILDMPQDTAHSQPARSTSDVLEELVGAVRALDARMAADGGAPKGRHGRSSKKFPWLDIAWTGKRAPASILVLAAPLREEAPYIYDLALEFYKAATQRGLAGARGEVQALRNMLDHSMHSRNAMVGFEELNAIQALRRELDVLAQRRPIRPATPTEPAPDSPASVGAAPQEREPEGQ